MADGPARCIPAWRNGDSSTGDGSQVSAGPGRMAPPISATRPLAWRGNESAVPAASPAASAAAGSAAARAFGHRVVAALVDLGPARRRRRRAPAAVVVQQQQRLGDQLLRLLVAGAERQRQEHRVEQQQRPHQRPVTDGGKFTTTGATVAARAVRPDRQLFADHSVEVKFKTPESSIWETLAAAAAAGPSLIGCSSCGCSAGQAARWAASCRSGARGRRPTRPSARARPSPTSPATRA